MLAADAHALLRAGRARVVALLAAEEHVLELVHPGVGEQQRRVVAGHQRRARDDAVAVAFEVRQERRRISRGMHLTIRSAGSAFSRMASKAKPWAARLADDAGPGLVVQVRGGAAAQAPLEGAGPGGRARPPRRRPRPPPSSAIVAVDAQLPQLLQDARPPAVPRTALSSRAAASATRRSLSVPSCRSRAMAASMSSGSICRRARRARNCASDSSRADSRVRAAM